ncbi:hypothetical protein PMAYCL1PPCAC_14644, partial [Pristionchus mayeri]
LQDNISDLSTDCLLDVFSRLSRSELCEVSTVSKRMHELTSDKSLDHIKWEGGELRILQISDIDQDGRWIVDH